VRGMDCVPQVKEVEARRPIPVLCQTDYDVAGVELRYQAPGSKKWEKVELPKTDAGYQGSIPCTVTAKRGQLKVYVFARNANNKVIARVGRIENPMLIRVVEHTNLPPPALPNQNAPERCYDKNDCPPEMVGTDACPGTKAAAAATTKKAWGQSCNLTSECQATLECVNGSCETPAKCDTAADCPSGGECNDGLCHVPDAEEIATRLGPPMHHWIGLHAGADIILMNEGSDVCGNTSEDSKSYACYEGGGLYAGTPNLTAQGHLSSGVRLATIRALLSYEYAVNRFLVGTRLGWAFRGAPQDFLPFHFEARLFYSMRKEPLDKRFRPYLGIVGGVAQVDGHGPVDIIDCVSTDPVNRQDCINAADRTTLDYFLADRTMAVRKTLNAYRAGSKGFFGPALMMVFALSNDSALVFNLNTLFPDVVFQPTLGYAMGL
ncbi:MAG TPA: hypothetical protein VGK73_17460, partial [Polyangiaceae bacterium]